MHSVYKLSCEIPPLHWMFVEITNGGQSKYESWCWLFNTADTCSLLHLLNKLLCLGWLLCCYVTVTTDCGRYTFKFVFVAKTLNTGPSRRYVCDRSPAEIVGSNPAGGMDVCLLWLLCVVRYRSLCDGLITRPEESYRLWCIVVCEVETSWIRWPWPTSEGGCCAKNRNKTLNTW